MSRKVITSVLAIGLALTVVACSSDDADDASSTPVAASDDTTATTETTDTTVAEDTCEAFCATNDEIDALFGDAEEPTALIDAANEALALTPDLVAEAHEDIAADVDVIVAATGAVAAGDPAGFATVEVQDATAAVNEFCGV